MTKHFKKIRAVEGVLWMTLTVCFGYGAFCLFQAKGTHFDQPVHAQQTAADTDGAIIGPSASAYSAGGAVADGEVIGDISIPSLGLKVPIVEGLSRQDLLRGVGHVPGSATAGGLGNMALAAHRDTFFRPLRNIKPGTVMLVGSPDGAYRYLVDKTEVVTPDQVAVLETGSVPQVTLITCYPFDYIGAAPKRFIVHGRLTSLVPVQSRD